MDSKFVSVNVSVELSNNFVYHILVTAFDAQYGGCNYWIDTMDVVRNTAERDDILGTMIWDGVRIEPQGDLSEYCTTEADNYAELSKQLMEDGGILVDGSVLARGFQKILDPIEGDYALTTIYKNTLEALMEHDAGMIDAHDADRLVQVGLFGEVVVG